MLHCSCFCLKLPRYLFGQLSLNLLLEPPEQEGPQYFVETTDDEDGLLLVQVHLAHQERCKPSMTSKGRAGACAGELKVIWSRPTPSLSFSDCFLLHGAWQGTSAFRKQQGSGPSLEILGCGTKGPWASPATGLVKSNTAASCVASPK